MASLEQLAAADRLRKLVKNQNGGSRCLILSKEHCECGLCDIDTLVAGLMPSDDKRRLDFLESEMVREQHAIKHEQPIPHSLFRRNNTITRDAIDREMSRGE